MFKFKFFEYKNTEKDCLSIKAVSSYEGKTITATADLHPEDNYDVELGKDIARRRCEIKLLKKKKKRFIRKNIETLADAERLENMAKKLRKRANNYIEVVRLVEDQISENEDNLNKLLNN